MRFVNHTPETFATVADKTEIAGCDSNDDVGGADNGLCWETSIKAVVGYAEACSRPRSEVINDQLELRIIDMGALYYGSQSKMDYDRFIEYHKAAYGDYLLSVGGILSAGLSR